MYTHANIQPVTTDNAMLRSSVSFVTCCYLVMRARRQQPDERLSRAAGRRAVLVELRERGGLVHAGGGRLGGLRLGLERRLERDGRLFRRAT